MEWTCTSSGSGEIPEKFQTVFRQFSEFATLQRFAAKLIKTENRRPECKTGSVYVILMGNAQKFTKHNVAAIMFPIKATVFANYLDTKLRAFKKNHCRPDLQQ